MSHSSADEHAPIATQRSRSDAQRDPLRDRIFAVMDGQDFQVTLEQLARLLRQQDSHLRRLLKAPDFKPGIDYRVEQVLPARPTRAGPRQRVLLTVDAFKRLVLTARGQRASQLRRCMAEAETASRERSTEPLVCPEQLGARRAPMVRYPRGSCVYVLRVEYDAQVVYKVGRTVHLSRRLTELRRTLSGRVTLVDYRLLRHHEFLEVCMHTLLKRFRLHKPEETTELFQVQPQEVFQALDACHAGWTVIQQYNKK